MELPTYLPPQLPTHLPVDVWHELLVNGVAKHMLEWLQEKLRDDQVIILALQMIDATITTSSWSIQTWLEVQYGKSRPNMYNLILRKAAAQIKIDLSSLSPPKPRDYGSRPLPDDFLRQATSPLPRATTVRNTD